MNAWTNEMPDRIGLWEMRCGETNNQPERVAITKLRNTLIVHDEHLDRVPLKTYHNGLTAIEWRFLA